MNDLEQQRVKMFFAILILVFAAVILFSAFSSLVLSSQLGPSIVVGSGL